MNYNKLYTRLSDNIKLRNRTFEKFKHEKHHIIPKSLGGDDNKKNIIVCTYREHFILHRLLCKIHQTNRSLKYALLGMCNKNSKIKYKNNLSYNNYINSKDYELLKLTCHKQSSIRNTNQVYVKDINGNTIVMSSDEYKQQSVHKFHTTGMVAVFDNKTNNKDYITVDERKSNPTRYTPLIVSNLNIKRSKFWHEDLWSNQIIRLTKTQASHYNNLSGSKRWRQIQKKNINILKGGVVVKIPLEQFNPKIHTSTQSLLIRVWRKTDNKAITILKTEYHTNPHLYTTISENKVNVIDINTGKKCRVSKEVYDNNPDRYTGWSKGLTTAKLKSTGQFVKISVDEFNLNKHLYVGSNAGKINCVNKITGKRKQILKIEFNDTEWSPLGATNNLFLTRNLLTNKEKRYNIYEWKHIDTSTLEIIEQDKFNKVKHLIK